MGADFGDYAGSGLSGAASGAAMGSPFGPVGAGVGGGLGLLYGLYSAYQTGKSADQQKGALSDAMAAATASGQKQAGLYGNLEQVGQSYVSPLDDLYKHFYGQNAPGVRTQDQQDAGNVNRRPIVNAGRPTSMRGVPPAPGTMAKPMGAPTPGLPGWYGPGSGQAPQPAPQAPAQPPTKKPAGFR